MLIQQNTNLNIGGEKILNLKHLGEQEITKQKGNKTTKNT